MFIELLRISYMGLLVRLMGSMVDRVFLARGAKKGFWAHRVQGSGLGLRVEGLQGHDLFCWRARLYDNTKWLRATWYSLYLQFYRLYLLIRG